MKIRSDFVTNSSSSSFICEICGRNESGWDLCLSECEMMECINGHTFCCDEALEKPTKDEMIKVILQNENNEIWDRELGDYKKVNETELSEYDEDELFDKFMSESGYYEVPECVCPICNFIEYSQHDLKNYLKKQYKVDEDEVFEEVKKLNKRRKKLYDEEYITHVCKKFDLSPIAIVAKWKEEFGTYGNFKEHLKV